MSRKAAKLDPEAWQVLRSQCLYDRPFLRLHEQHVRLTNGHEIHDFCVVESPPWVAVVALTSTRELVLVRQYRHGIQSHNYELPAGAIEPGENPLHAAQRELREETGFESSKWCSLTRLAVDPSRHTAQAHFFIAYDARRVGDATPEPSEQIMTRLVPARSVVACVLGQPSGEAGRLQVDHGLHVAAILMAEARGVLSGEAPG